MATMLKKRKHKMKRRNTEPHMQLPLAGATALPEPSSAPPVAGAAHAHAQSYARQPPVRLVDLCDSPTHATPV